MPKFEGTVEDIVFRNDSNGWTVISLKMDGSGRISAVGTMPFLAPGERVVLDGEIVQHRDYGEQIKVTGYETVLPETKSGVERYLASGLIKGVGPATAKLIVRHFGARALDVLESEPHRLTEIDGIGPKRAAQIAESFHMQNEMRQTLIFLQGYGLTPNLSMKVYKAFGDMTETVLRANPYRLVDEVDGVGFKTADGIAMAMGFTAESEFRLLSGIKYVLSEATGSMGHVYLPLNELLDQSARILNVDLTMADTAVRKLILQSQLVSEQIEGETVIYLPKLFDAEMDVARLLGRLRRSSVSKKVSGIQLSDDITRYEVENGVTLCAEQRDAVLAAAQEGICVITGGPGTGKTTSINCIIRLLERQGDVELCAPTGRAAKRMSEATGRNARTIHRMLEYNGEEESFSRDSDNPLECDAVIVDEMSMVDIFLMRSLLRALRPGTRLIMVGDADQLPSVGAGNVLRDIISSGALRVVKLTEIFRQAQESMIVVNAHHINRGEYPLVKSRDTDFFLERKDSVQDAAASVVALVKTRLPNYKGFDSLRGIQVMAPMKRGEIGVFALNRMLQAALNPPSPAKPELPRGETIFRLGDKVMQIRNNYDLEWHRGAEEGQGVFNGDIGYIVAVDRSEATLTVEFDDARVAEYDEAILDELEHAYCMSVHKSQGSEFEAVVMPLVTGPRMLMTRNLLYTAVTRAKKLVVLVGRETCVRQMVDNNHIMHRYSALERRLQAMG